MTKPIVIGCDMASGTDSIVSIAAKALADGGIKVISYEMLRDAVRFGTGVAMITNPGIKYINHFEFYSGMGRVKPKKIRKPLPGYRQIEMKKRKY